MAAFIPAIISGVSALAGGLFGQPQKTTQQTNQTTTQNATQSQSQQGSASSLPNYDPLQLQMRNYLLGQFYQNLNPNAINSTVSNYIGTGTQNINANANSARQNLSAYLGAQGLTYSPAAASAYGSSEANRVGQINQLENSAPQLASNLTQQRLSSFSQYLASLPVGSSSTSSGSTTGTSSGTTNVNGTTTTTGPNNVAAGAVGGAASALAGLYGMGAFTPNAPVIGGSNYLGSGGNSNAPSTNYFNPNGSYNGVSLPGSNAINYGDMP